MISQRKEVIYRCSLLMSFDISNNNLNNEKIEKSDLENVCISFSEDINIDDNNNNNNNNIEKGKDSVDHTNQSSTNPLSSSSSSSRIDDLPVLMKEELHIRISNDDDDDEVNLALKIDDEKIIFQRKREDYLSIVLNRIKLTLYKKLKKKKKFSKLIPPELSQQKSKVTKKKKKQQDEQEQEHEQEKEKEDDTIFLYDSYYFNNNNNDDDDDDDDNEKLRIIHNNNNQLKNDENTWRSGQILKVIYYGYILEFDIIVNPPLINRLQYKSKLLMTSFPIMAEVDHEFTGTCEFRWFRGNAQFWDPILVDNNNDKNNNNNNDNNMITNEEQKKMYYNNPLYTPSKEDIGNRLKVMCTPISTCGKLRGRSVYYSSLDIVKDGCQSYLEKFRSLPLLLATKNKKNNGNHCFRIVSYNILADAFGNSNYARKELYPYCKPEFLTMDYRYSLMIKELYSYQADIICLQECDKNAFQHYLLPVFSMDDKYHCLKRFKSGNVREGCAMFIRKSVFNIEEDISFHMKDIIENEKDFESLNIFQPLFERFHHLYDILLNKITTTFQFIILSVINKPLERLLLINTHFFYHPKAGHIRLIQAYIILKKINEKVELLQEQGYKTSVILCGDFNSTPSTAQVQLFLGKSVDASYSFHERTEAFVWGNRVNSDDDNTSTTNTTNNNNGNSTIEEKLLEDEKVLLGAIENPYVSQFISACGFPLFTNFVRNFVECLDYIFIEESRFKINYVAEMPNVDVVSENVALPSEHFPSDHLSILADIELIS